MRGSALRRNKERMRIAEELRQLVRSGNFKAFHPTRFLSTALRWSLEAASCVPNGISAPRGKSMLALATGGA